VAAAPPGRQGRPQPGGSPGHLHHAIGELPEGAVVLAEDETHINLLPWVRATWIANGTRQQVMTPGTNRRRTIFGAVDLHTGRWFYQVARKAVSATFIAFLDQLAAGYPAAPTVAMVCDNVIIHHSKIVQRWLAAHPRVVVLHGARYSPHDNPVERIWGVLKAWLATSPTLTIQGRLRQVHAFFRQRSPTQILATAARPAHRGCPRVTCRTSGRPLSPPCHGRWWISSLRVVCCPTAAQQRSFALRALKRPGAGPGLSCGFLVEPPPESNRRPHPYHRCAGGSRRHVAPHVSPQSRRQEAL
jgi:transposase